MGLPLESNRYDLVEWDNSPVSENEFNFLGNDEFYAPIEELKLVEAKSFTIPGLMTQSLALKEKYLSQINQFPVGINFLNNTEHSVAEKSYRVYGRNRVADLIAMVHDRLSLSAFAHVELSAHGIILDPETMLLKLYPSDMSPDGFLELDCDYYDVDAGADWAPNVFGNHGFDDDDGDNDDDVNDDGTEGDTHTRRTVAPTCVIPSDGGSDIDDIVPKWLIPRPLTPKFAPRPLAPKIAPRPLTRKIALPPLTPKISPHPGPVGF